jgi:hypothetical protein
MSLNTLASVFIFAFMLLPFVYWLKISGRIISDQRREERGRKQVALIHERLREAETWRSVTKN